MIKFFTSFNKYYGDRALLLADSIRKFCTGEFSITALMVDKLNPREEKLFLSHFDDILYPHDVSPFADLILGSHTVVEACTVFKPFAMSRLLQAEDCDMVVYMDPDTMVVSDFTAYLRGLDAGTSVHLTPHLCFPAPGFNFHAAESSALKHGIYNLGYAGARNDDVGRAFADWWGRRILLSCAEGLGSGHFTDQKIIDMCPAVFPNVTVDRYPGLNVAPWNMHERKVSFGGDALLVNGERAYFFHFSKINHVGAGEILRACSDDGGALEIALYYKNWMEQKTRLALLAGVRGEWAYALDDDGSRRNEARRLENRACYVNRVMEMIDDGILETPAA
ncbi:MAG: hypothetical protein ACREWI_16480 [Telluria sp.]